MGDMSAAAKLLIDLKFLYICVLSQKFFGAISHYHINLVDGQHSILTHKMLLLGHVSTRVATLHME